MDAIDGPAAAQVGESPRFSVGLLAGVLLLDALRIIRMIRRWRKVVAHLRAKHDLVLMRSRSQGLLPLPVGPGGASLRDPDQPPLRDTLQEIIDLGWKVRTLDELEDDVEFEVLLAMHMVAYENTQGEDALGSMMRALMRCRLTLVGLVNALYPASGRPLAPNERLLWGRLKGKVEDAADRRKRR